MTDIAERPGEPETPPPTIVDPTETLSAISRTALNIQSDSRPFEGFAPAAFLSAVEDSVVESGGYGEGLYKFSINVGANKAPRLYSVGCSFLLEEVKRRRSVTYRKLHVHASLPFATTAPDGTRSFGYADIPLEWHEGSDVKGFALFTELTDVPPQPVLSRIYGDLVTIRQSVQRARGLANIASRDARAEKQRRQKALSEKHAAEQEHRARMTTASEANEDEPAELTES